MDLDSSENGCSSFSSNFISEQTKPILVDASVQFDLSDDCITETEFPSLDVQNFTNVIDMKLPIAVQSYIPLNLHIPPPAPPPPELLVISGNGGDLLSDPKLPLMQTVDVNDISAGRRFCVDSVVDLEQPHSQTYIFSLQDGLASIVEVVDQNGTGNCDSPETIKARQKVHSKHRINQNWFTSKAEKTTLHKRGHIWKQGMWSKEEINLLESNIKEYCEQHDIQTPATVIFHTAKDERKDFYRTIAKGLNRPLFSVYRRVIRMYDNKNHVGKYTTEELEKLKQLRSLHGNNWQAIGNAMGRSAASIKDRCRLMRDNCNQGKWLPAEEKRLAEAVHELANILPGEMISSGLSWADVAERVGTRSEKQCRTKWLNYLNWKEAGGTDWTREDDVTLISRISMFNAKDENQIDWNELAKGWMSARSPQWLRGKWWTLKRHAPNANNIPFQDLCEYLYEQCVMKLKLTLGDSLNSLHSSMIDDNISIEPVLQQQIFAQPDPIASEIVVTDVPVDCLPSVISLPNAQPVKLNNEVYPPVRIAPTIERLKVLANPTVQLSATAPPFLTNAHTVQSIPLTAAMTKGPIIIHTLPVVRNLKCPVVSNSNDQRPSSPVTCLASTQTSSLPPSPESGDRVALNESGNLLNEVESTFEANNESQRNMIMQNRIARKGSPTVHFIISDPMMTSVGQQRSEDIEFAEKTCAHQGCGTDD